MSDVLPVRQGVGELPLAGYTAVVLSRRPDMRISRAYLAQHYTRYGISEASGVYYLPLKMQRAETGFNIHPPLVVVVGVLHGFATIPRPRPGTQERPNAPASTRPACDRIAVSSKVPQRRTRF